MNDYKVTVNNEVKQKESAFSSNHSILKWSQQTIFCLLMRQKANNKGNLKPFFFSKRDNTQKTSLLLHLQHTTEAQVLFSIYLPLKASFLVYLKHTHL